MRPKTQTNVSDIGIWNKRWIIGIWVVKSRDTTSGAYRVHQVRNNLTLMPMETTKGDCKAIRETKINLALKSYMDVYEDILRTMYNFTDTQIGYIKQAYVMGARKGMCLQRNSCRSVAM